PISAIVMRVDAADLTGYPCALHDDSAGGGKRAVDGSGTRGFRDGASHQCDLGIIGANTIRLRRSRPAVPDAFEELLVPFSPRPHHRNSFDWSVWLPRVPATAISALHSGNVREFWRWSIRIPASGNEGRVAHSTPAADGDARVPKEGESPYPASSGGARAPESGSSPCGGRWLRCP